MSGYRDKANAGKMIPGFNRRYILNTNAQTCERQALSVERAAL